MIIVNIDQKPDKIRITIHGHAEPRVCAGVSSLFAALEGALMNDYPDEYTYTDNGSGFGEIVMPKAAEKFFRMFLVGVKRIEATFGNQVAVVCPGY